MQLLSKIKLVAGLLMLAFASTTVANAQSQHDLTTPTGWWWIDNGSFQDIVDRTNLGYRLVDLEITGTSNYTYTASFVRNTGAYQKAYWWYVGQTVAEVNAALSANNARLIDIEPFRTSAGIRYASIMIANTGADAVASGWYTNLSTSGLDNFIANQPTRRMIALEPYFDGTTERYAYIWVQNTGTFATGWWYFRNTNRANIDNFMAQNNARLIDLERNVDSSNHSAVLIPSDGRSTWHLYGISSSQVTEYAEQFAARVVDVERRPILFGQTFDIVLRQNDNDLTIAANNAMRANLSLGASSGLLLRRFDSGSTTVAGVKESTPFEPASLMKTAHHLTAMQRVVNGTQSLSSPITVFTGLNGSCPTGTAPVTRPLETVLSRMMEQSSNTDTWALQASYGSALIENTSSQAGAPGIDINHIIGCLCGSPRNQGRLLDFSAIHEYVADGNLGAFEEDFHSLMLNSSDFALGSANSNATLNSVLDASSLSSTEKATFRFWIKVAAKDGSYTCNAGPEEHRSMGTYLRVPFKSGCTLALREYFLGAWVNDEVNGVAASEAVGQGTNTIWQSILSDAVASWETANCTVFSNYCQATSNSTGQTGSIDATGMTYFLNPTPISVTASNLPVNSTCYLLAGPSTGFVQNPAGSAGNLCLSGSLGRYLTQVQQTSASGTALSTMFVTNIPHPSLGSVSLMTGDTYHFQYWHRDSSSSGAPTSNFTNGLTVRVL